MADKTGYIGRNPNDSAVTVARQFFTASGVTTTFTFASGYLTGYLDVYVDGVKRRVADEFTATDGSTFDVLQGGVSAGSTVEAVAYKAFNAAAISGDITGNFDVSGNSTLGGSLSVTGGTTLSNLNVTGITTLGAGTTVAFANTAFNLSGTPDISVDLLSAVDINVSGAATIGGVLTYEDVTNIDSVGIVTARTGVEVTANGLVVNAGVSTFAADVSIADKIVHTGDTNTAIRFPSADTITAETAGTERLRITSGGDITLAGIATVFGATGIVSATAFYGDGSNLDNTGSTLSAPSSGTQRVVTTSQTSGTMTSTGTGAELAFDYSNNHLEFSDSTKATFGTSNDLEIYHDGSNSYIKNSTGVLRIHGTEIQIRDEDNNENLAKFFPQGAVELYYDNSKKFETKSDGVDITGELQCDSLDVDGNADISGTLQVNGETTFITHVRWGDSDKALFGAGDDLQIYHDGTDSRIDNNTGDLYLETTGSGDDVIIKAVDDVIIQTAGSENAIVCSDNGNVALYHNNVNTFQTTDSGIVLKGAEAGAAILEMYADEGDDNADKFRFHVSDGGPMRIQNYASGGWENNILLNGNGSVQLMHDDNTRLETTTDGVDISGTGSIKVPVGTTAQRNSSPTAGDFRYNSTEGKFEGYTSEWGEIGGGGGISTAAQVVSNDEIHLALSSAQDHKVTATGLCTVFPGGGVEGESHTIRIINAGAGTTVGFSTQFLFPSGSAPVLPTADGAISLISFTVNKVGVVGIATELLAGASLNYS